MSDIAFPPAFMEPDEIAGPVRRRRDNPEHRFQAWVDRLLDRIVLPPMFTTGIDHASQTTDNARARMAGRGVKFGLPDVFVCQPGVSLWIELKRGSKLAANQAGVHAALESAGQHVATADTMRGVVEALDGAGFVLHDRAHAIAHEYELRVQAKEKAPATPRAPGKLRKRERHRRVTRHVGQLRMGGGL